MYAKLAVSYLNIIIVINGNLFNILLIF